MPSTSIPFPLVSSQVALLELPMMGQSARSRPSAIPGQATKVLPKPGALCLKSGPKLKAARPLKEMAGYLGFSTPWKPGKTQAEPKSYSVRKCSSLSDPLLSIQIRMSNWATGVKSKITPPKTNTEPENEALEEEISIINHHVSFRGGIR